MHDTSYQKQDEIDLLELLATLWYHKILIAVITSIFLFCSGFYILTSDKQYTATAIFEIEQGNSKGLNLPSEFGALASIAGRSGVESSISELLIERIQEREFILEVSKNLSLQNDSFFQIYDPNVIDPVWKNSIKKLFRWEQPNQNEAQIIESTIQESYLEYVQASQTPAGAIKISVTHESPTLAARYTNQIMELVRQTVIAEEEKSKEMRLSYLAETLADALEDMEAAQKNIKKYTLENSAAAQENFIVGSLQLDSLRLERREAVEYLSLLQTLRDLVKLESSIQALMKLSELKHHLWMT